MAARVQGSFCTVCNISCARLCSVAGCKPFIRLVSIRGLQVAAVKVELNRAGARVLVAGILLMLAGCGGADHGTRMEGDSPLRSTDRVISLAEAIDAVDSLPAPAGVEDAIWRELRQKLVHSLQSQNLERFTSTAPRSEASAVNDLKILHDP